MANDIGTLVRKTKNLDSEIQKIIKETLIEYVQKIYNEAMAGIPDSSIRATYNIEVREGGYSIVIYSDSDDAAYMEFRTGEYAAQYLATQPNEVSIEAQPFIKTGTGTLYGNPSVFPTWYKYRDEIAVEIDKRVQKLFDSI